MSFLHPELLLLALPALAVVWRTRPRAGFLTVLRMAAALALVLALAVPLRSIVEPGRDLVVVVDRSLSMPRGTDESAVELIGFAEERRQPGDRVAVVAFGERATIDRLPDAAARFEGFRGTPGGQASELAEALETALALVPPGRAAALLVISDGQSTGSDPLVPALHAASRGIPIHVRQVARERGGDVSVDRVELPARVDAGEPFQWSAWVTSDGAREVDWELERDRRLIASGRAQLRSGSNRLLFRDTAQLPGSSVYRVRLRGARDAFPENDAGLGATWVRGERSILVINHDGQEDSLTRALAGAGIPVTRRSPETADLSPVALTRHRAVVLENVAARRLGTGLAHLADSVRDRGTGLLVTGGRASFGVGGYHLSPIDRLLPVSMELREEHRELSMALALALDRSGSMAAPASGGLSKMDLANRGAIAAVELLSFMDEVAVLAVDTSAHAIVSRTAVSDTNALTRRIRSIQSGGGGIYVRNALEAAADELAGAPQATRHIVVFADASDAEQQDGCESLARRLAEQGTTLSVIALGTRGDVHGAFLERLAQAGQGEIYFTTAAAELPQLFALDTLTVARSAFVEGPVATRELPGLALLGAPPLAPLLDLGGYNLTYVRDEAVAALATADDYGAPLVAMRQAGLGRAAVFTGQIGGTHGAALPAWSGFAPLFVSLARWVLGTEELAAVHADVRLEGRELVVTAELDPEREATGLGIDPTRLAARLALPGRTLTLPLERSAEFLYSARVRLDRPGVALGALILGPELSVPLPPATLSYPPEFQRSADPERGTRLLRRLARTTSGLVGPSAEEFFPAEAESRAWRPRSLEFLAAALALFLLEVAWRRLGLAAPDPVKPVRALWQRRGRARARAAEELERESGSPADPGVAVVTAERREGGRESDGSDPAPDGLSDVLRRARRTATDRLDR